MSDDPSSSPIQPFRPLPDPTWRDRVDAIVARVRALDRPGRTLMAVAGAAIVVLVVGFALLRPSSAGSAPEDYLPLASTTASSGGPPSSAASSTVVAQAAGAVVRPGLYRLAPGGRVDDLVKAAGGFAPDADPDRINLAALVADGQRIYVPRIGEALPPSDATSPGAAAPGPIDLNTATIAQLDTLPGIGPATAQAIVDYRAQHGRFRSVDELLNVRGIGAAKLDEIRGLVRV